MSEEEAELVLLSLAQPLEWEIYPDGEIAGAPNGCYTACQNLVRGSPCVFVYVAEYEDYGNGTASAEIRSHFAPHPYATDAAAKAACERHYRTGNWK